jgi:DNA polymerase I-like protein with 3'-5' exonuclease and polymerase domains
VISFDSETTGIDHFHGAKPFFVTTCNEYGSQIWWEWDVNPYTRKPEIPEEDAREIRQFLVVQDKGIVLQNSKFDAMALLVAEITDWQPLWPLTEDTLTAGHLLASNHKHDLTSMCIEYLQKDIQPFEDRLEEAVKEARRIAKAEYTGKTTATLFSSSTTSDWQIAGKDADGMPSAKEKTWKFDTWLPRAIAKEKGYKESHLFWTVLRDYANADSLHTLMLWGVQEKLLHERGLWKIYKRQLRLQEIAWSMERAGITGNIKRLGQQRVEYESGSLEAAGRCTSIAKELGYDLQLPKGANNKSLMQFVYGPLGVPVNKTSKKTGAPSLDKGVIEDCIAHGQPDTPAYDFMTNLRDKRKRDTACSYMDSYARFWIRNGYPGWFTLHPSLNPTGTDTLRWSSNNPNSQNVCFDGDTELLTEDGWTTVSKLLPGQKVAQYWKDGSINFVVPVLHQKYFNGNLKHIRTRRYIDMLLTPAHRCLLKDRKTNKFEDVRAENFKPAYLHINAGMYRGGNKALSKAQVAWLCAVQADGHYCKTGNCDYGIQFIFKKKRKIARLNWILSTLSIRHTTKTTGDLVRFYIGTHEPANKLAREMMPSKQFGSWLLTMDRLTLDLFCNEVFFWDGCWERKSMYSSSDESNSVWVQTLLALSGTRAYVNTKTPKNAWAVRDHHYVWSTNGKDNSMTTNCAITDVPWNNFVYCVTVPSSYVLIKRNGRISVTGNSKTEGFNLRRCFGPKPDREWWSLDAKNIELRIPAYEAGEKDMIYVFEHPNDAPYYGSYHLLVCALLHPQLFKQHGKAFKEVFESTWYQWAKNGSFAVIYGAQRETADRTYHVIGASDKIRHRFPKIAKLADKQIELANQRGYVETIPDKYIDPARGYPLLCSRSEYGGVNPTTPLNYHVSGTAMWWMNGAMIRCYDKLAEWRRVGFSGFITLQVHDELIFDFPRINLFGVDGKMIADPKATNLGKIRVIKQLMEMGGEGIGVPTPVSVKYIIDSWDRGVTVN